MAINFAELASVLVTARYMVKLGKRYGYINTPATSTLPQTQPKIEVTQAERKLNEAVL